MKKVFLFFLLINFNNFALSSIKENIIYNLVNTDNFTSLDLLTSDGDLFTLSSSSAPSNISGTQKDKNIIEIHHDNASIPITSSNSSVNTSSKSFKTPSNSKKQSGSKKVSNVNNNKYHTISDIKINNVKYGLYVVSTPIGNLGDITFRAIEILNKSDHIFCEDTRVSKKLLSKFKIHKKLISNHKFNEKKNIKSFLNFLNSKKIVSMISDAGTPTVSDPGNYLINKCIENKIDIFPIPGASSVISSISISGFTNRFYFYGFFPEKISTLNRDMNFIKDLDSSIIFFVPAKKINKHLKVFKNFFLNRKILICREMTKFYEEYIRCNIKELEPFDKEPKGELTIVVSEKKINKKNSFFLRESDKLIVKKMINKFTIKEITNYISLTNKVSKKEIYNYCLRLKNEK